MTPDEFRRAREELGLTGEKLAKLVQVADSRTVRRWEAGDRDIPGPVIVLISAMLESAEVRRFFGVSLKSERSI